MAGPINKVGECRNALKLFIDKSTGRRPLGLDVNGTIILDWMFFKKWE